MDRQESQESLINKGRNPTKGLEGSKSLILGGRETSSIQERRETLAREGNLKESLEKEPRV